MIFDPKLVEAKLALGMIKPEEMPALACDALESGLDGPAMLRLAGLVHPSGWETDQLLPAFMAEAGLENVPLERASIRVARELALRIVKNDLDPLDHTREFELLWIRADYPSVLQAVGGLDDDKHLADSLGRSEGELRGYAWSVLMDLIATDEPKPQD